MAQKDAQYHKDAIYYNQVLAEAAEKVETEVDTEEVKRWNRAVSKQHRFHEKRHVSALAKLESKNPSGVGTELQHGDELTIISSNGPSLDEKYDDEIHEAEPAEDVDYRDAGTGRYVTEDYAEEHPETTVSEVDVPRASGDVMSPFEVRNNQQEQENNA